MNTFREWEAASVAQVANPLPTWTLVGAPGAWAALSIANVLAVAVAVVVVQVSFNANNLTTSLQQLSRILLLTNSIDWKLGITV